MLFPAHNSFLLTKAISNLIAEPELRSRLGQAAKARVEELFTWDSVAYQLGDFYTEQIKQQNLESLHKLLHRSVKAMNV